jgi:hypothetical protein
MRKLDLDSVLILVGPTQSDRCDNGSEWSLSIDAN